MNRLHAKAEASNECIFPLLNVLKPSVCRIGNPLHILLFKKCQTVAA